MSVLTKDLEGLKYRCMQKYLYTQVDWEQRRYEIAKEMLPVFYQHFDGTIKWQCETALKYADELIELLRNGSSTSTSMP